jgi:sugar lactone lactonase YvrE
VAALELFADGLSFPECPRWHDGGLWISDMRAGAVLRFDAGGGRRTVTELDGDEPGGLGWLPDGRLLVVGMYGRRVWRLDGAGLAVHAELGTERAPWGANDMIVNDTGVAFVSQVGFDMTRRTTVLATSLLRVRPDGGVDVAAPDMMVPNGITLSEDGSTMVVAETWADRLTAFTVADDATLIDRRVFAGLSPAAGVRHARPDGVCADLAGAVWVADFAGRRVLRVEAGGRVTHDIACDGHPLAVVLGGAERRDLYVCAVARMLAEPTPEPGGRLDVLTVDVPGQGRP